MLSFESGIIYELIWIIFGYFFLLLALLNLPGSKNQIKKINFPSGPMAGKINGISTGISELKVTFAEYNDYLDEQNKSAIRQNYITSLGYFLASATAFTSLFIEVVGK